MICVLWVSSLLLPTIFPFDSRTIQPVCVLSILLRQVRTVAINCHDYHDQFNGILFQLSLYWIPKLQKCPQKQRYIAMSANCTTKHVSKLLTYILSAVIIGLQSYCDTSYFRACVNQMWILKNSKDLLEYIESMFLSSCASIKHLTSIPFTPFSTQN